ncbi:unnamed protein product [Heligmosomoides polygyrus]|uniref:Copine domain-containing protein n=1 Tax=Heligmosomoides polygyrus TaxID=6339 RepID=A0A183FEK6_HELPZ|nr:unnamed protein product [Heligmosomoides polygyrus]
MHCTSDPVTPAAKYEQGLTLIGMNKIFDYVETKGVINALLVMLGVPTSTSVAQLLRDQGSPFYNCMVANVKEGVL